MARSGFLQDHLQQHTFWLLDVAPVDAIGLPIFTPVFGFSEISAPEITMETTNFGEGNWFFRRKVLRRGNASPVTLRRGVFWLDSDFYRWMSAAITGDPGDRAGIFSGGLPGPSPRRNLLLIHFFRTQPFDSVGGNLAVSAGGLTAVTAAASSLSPGDLSSSLATAGLAAASTAAFIGLGSALGSSAGVIRVPAKAWTLVGCIPTRYKPASDYDANSAAISVAELDVAVERIEEISLAA